VTAADRAEPVEGRPAVGGFLFVEGAAPRRATGGLGTEQPVAGEDVLGGVLFAGAPAAAVATGAGEALSTVPTVLHATSSARAKGGHGSDPNPPPQ
jgi:hypothetical protein